MRHGLLTESVSPAKHTKFSAKQRNQVPAVSPPTENMLDGLPDPSVFYHVHSYVPHPADEADVLGVSEYGESFASVVGRGSVFGAQFHPEKSSVHGLRLLANFAGLCARATA